MNALKIINRWITIAHENQMQPHFMYFWYIRDLLEGHKDYMPESRIPESLDFLKTKCKASPERDALLEGLKNKGVE